MSETADVHDHPVNAVGVAAARAGLPTAAVVAGIAAQLSLASDVTRLRILLGLRAGGELCVGDLAIALEISDDAVGYGLRMLRMAGLVAFRKAGRVVFYRLADGFPEPLLDHCVLRLAQLAEAGEEDGPP
jgi:DNA-binding transcriptional ArsR family regulator